MNDKRLIASSWLDDKRLIASSRMDGKRLIAALWPSSCTLSPTTVRQKHHLLSHMLPFCLGMPDPSAASPSGADPPGQAVFRRGLWGGRGRAGGDALIGMHFTAVLWLVHWQPFHLHLTK